MRLLCAALAALAGCHPSMHIDPGSYCPPFEDIGFDDPSPFGPSLAELVGPPPALLTYSPGDEIADWIPKSQEWLDEPPVITVAPQWDSFTEVAVVPTTEACDVGYLWVSGRGMVEVGAFGENLPDVPLKLTVHAGNANTLSGIRASPQVDTEAVIDAMLAEGRDPPLEGWIYSVHASPEIVAVQNFPAPGNDEAGNAIVKRAAVVDPPLFAGGRLRSDGTLLPED